MRKRTKRGKRFKYTRGQGLEPKRANDLHSSEQRRVIIGSESHKGPHAPEYECALNRTNWSSFSSDVHFWRAGEFGAVVATAAVDWDITVIAPLFLLRNRSESRFSARVGMNE